jgi:hypothetical protein
VMLLVRSYRGEYEAVARHLGWPQIRVQAAVSYAEAFPEEIDEALAEQDAMDIPTLKRMLPQATEFVAQKKSRR